VKKRFTRAEKRSPELSPPSVQKERFTLKRNKPMMRVSSTSSDLPGLRSFTHVYSILSLEGTPRNEASPPAKGEGVEKVARRPSMSINGKANVDEKQKTPKSPSVLSFRSMKDDEANYK
jgi:hypothetical protein